MVAAGVVKKPGGVEAASLQGEAKACLKTCKKLIQDASEQGLLFGEWCLKLGKYAKRLVPLLEDLSDNKVNPDVEQLGVNQLKELEKALQRGVDLVQRCAGTGRLGGVLQTHILAGEFGNVVNDVYQGLSGLQLEKLGCETENLEEAAMMLGQLQRFRAPFQDQHAPLLAGLRKKAEELRSALLAGKGGAAEADSAGEDFEDMVHALVEGCTIQQLVADSTYAKGVLQQCVSERDHVQAFFLKRLAEVVDALLPEDVDTGSSSAPVMIKQAPEVEVDQVAEEAARLVAALKDGLQAVETRLDAGEEASPGTREVPLKRPMAEVMKESQERQALRDESLEDMQFMVGCDAEEEEKDDAWRQEACHACNCLREAGAMDLLLSILSIKGPPLAPKAPLEVECADDDDDDDDDDDGGEAAVQRNRRAAAAQPMDVKAPPAFHKQVKDELLRTSAVKKPAAELLAQMCSCDKAFADKLVQEGCVQRLLSTLNINKERQRAVQGMRREQMRKSEMEDALALLRGVREAVVALLRDLCALSAEARRLVAGPDHRPKAPPPAPVEPVPDRRRSSGPGRRRSRRGTSTDQGSESGSGAAAEPPPPDELGGVSLLVQDLGAVKLKAAGRSQTAAAAPPKAKVAGQAVASSQQLETTAAEILAIVSAAHPIAVVVKGGVLGLVAALASPSEATTCHAARALEALAHGSPERQQSIVQQGGVPALVALTHDGTPAQIQSAEAALKVVMKADGAQSAASNGSDVPAAASKEAAAGAKTKAALESIPAMLDLLLSGSDACLKETVEGLSVAAAAKKESAKLIVDHADALEELIELATNPSSVARVDAAQTLRAASRQPDLKPLLAKGVGVRLVNGEKPVQKEAVRLILQLAPPWEPSEATMGAQRVEPAQASGAPCPAGWARPVTATEKRSAGEFVAGLHRAAAIPPMVAAAGWQDPEGRLLAFQVCAEMARWAPQEAVSLDLIRDHSSAVSFEDGEPLLLPKMLEAVRQAPPPPSVPQGAAAAAPGEPPAEAAGTGPLAQAARAALRELSAVESIGESVVELLAAGRSALAGLAAKHGVVPELLKVVTAAANDSVKEAAAALLAELAGASAACCDAVTADGGLAKLLTLLQGTAAPANAAPSDAVCLSAACTLGTLAAQKSNCIPELVEADCMGGVLDVLWRTKDGAKDAAIQGVAVLAKAHPESAAEAQKAAVAKLGRGRPHEQDAAARVMRALTKLSALREALVKGGALPGLCALCGNQRAGDGARAAAAEALANLAVPANLKGQVGREAVSGLVELLRSKNEACVKAAALALLTLAEDTSIAEQMKNSGAGRTLQDTITRAKKKVVSPETGAAVEQPFSEQTVADLRNTLVKIS